MEVQKRINNTSAPHKAPVSRFHRQSGCTFDNVIFEDTQRTVIAPQSFIAAGMHSCRFFIKESLNCINGTVLTQYRMPCNRPPGFAPIGINLHQQPCICTHRQKFYQYMISFPKQEHHATHGVFVLCGNLGRDLNRTRSAPSGRKATSGSVSKRSRPERIGAEGQIPPSPPR